MLSCLATCGETRIYHVYKSYSRIVLLALKGRFGKTLKKSQNIMKMIVALNPLR